MYIQYINRTFSIFKHYLRYLSKSFQTKKLFYLYFLIANNYLQDGLRRRMDKLKSSIEEGNRAVDKEREKNVSLLHLIFPPDIAKRLWLGKYFYYNFSERPKICTIFIITDCWICLIKESLLLFVMIKSLTSLDLIKASQPIA